MKQITFYLSFDFDKADNAHVMMVETSLLSNKGYGLGTISSKKADKFSKLALIPHPLNSEKNPAFPKKTTPVQIRKGLHLTSSV